MPDVTLPSVLAELGLAACADLLAAADVDLDVLPLLSDADLREVGLSLGHRRKLLHAIGTGELERIRTQLAETEAPAPRGHASPERRRLTVLFCDLIDSTPLTQRFEPDEVGRLIRLFQEQVTAAVTGAGGHAERFLGDGVLAYFGYPIAQENAVELAVRGGLAAIAAVEGITTSSGDPLAVRAAVDTGLVFIDSSRAGGIGEQIVAGEAINLAARMQQVAPPNRVVVSAEAARILQGIFELRSLGQFSFKGFDHEVEALEVGAEREAMTRYAAARSSVAAPVLGRGAELELLLNRWEAARTGEGQVVLVGSESGMGKSTLANALIESVKAHPHYVVSYQCSAFHANSPLQPSIAHLQRAARFLATDSNETKLDKLAELLGRTGDPAEAVPLAANLLSLPLDGRGTPPEGSPDVLKNRTLEMLLAHFLELADQRPTLLLVEDAHWIDPTTTELLSMLIETIADVPAMVLVTYRPDFKPRWAQLTHATVVQLSRLSKRAGQELVEHVAGKPLPPEVLGQILSKTDGVPLFIEELTKAVLDLHILDDDGDRWVLRGPLPQFAIPTTLQDSLLARVDRLHSVKEVAQVGAVIGREFSLRHLAAMGDFEPAGLEAAIGQLVHAELIYQRGLPDQIIYSFKHALIQDAAYSTLNLARRQQLHRRCAEILLQLSPATGEHHPEVLAHHYQHAGDAVVAAGHWLRAGRRSVERSANVEAIAHLASGLQTLEAIDPSPERERTELALRIELGMPNIAVYGYAADRTWQNWARARDLADTLHDTETLARACYGLWAANVSKGVMGEALAFAERVLAAAEQLDDSGARIVGRRVRGLTRLLMGDLDEADADLGATLAAFDPERHRDVVLRFGQHPRGAALAAMTLLRGLQCRDEESARFGAASIREADQARHANSLAYAYSYGGCIPAMVQGDVARARLLSGRLIDLSARHGMALWHAYGQLCRGWVMSQDGNEAEGAAVMAEALDAYNAAGSCLYEPLQVGLLAQAQARCGMFDAAKSTIERGLEMANLREELWCRPELLRINAAILLAADANAASRAAAMTLLDAAADEAAARQLLLFERRANADRHRLGATAGVDIAAVCRRDRML